jgi:hypothetical protein
METDFQTISIRIDQPVATVAAFLGCPNNFRHWASGLASGSPLSAADQFTWQADTPAGPVRVRFAAPNEWGVADHWVTLPEGRTVYIPLRAMAFGASPHTSTLVSLTLFREPDMDDARFAADAKWVERDLERLRWCLEADAARLT